MASGNTSVHPVVGKRRVQLITCTNTSTANGVGRDISASGSVHDDADDEAPLAPGDEMIMAGRALIHQLLSIVHSLEKSTSRPHHPEQIEERLTNAICLLSELSDVVGPLRDRTRYGLHVPGQQALLHRLERVQDFVQRKLQEIQTHNGHGHSRQALLNRNVTN